MNIYIVERGAYEERFVHGVFSTLEKAMASCNLDSDDSWSAHHNGVSWDNTKPGAYEATITEYELDKP